MKGQYKIYGVFLKEEEIFKGKRGEICDHFGIKPHGFYEYAKGNIKLRSKYEVIPYYKGKLERQPKLVEENTDPTKDKLGYLIRHLKLYGDVNVSSFDPVPYLPELYDMGFDCHIKEWRDEDGKLNMVVAV